MKDVDQREHSRGMLDGPHRAGARAMLRAFGLKDEDFRKPQIGVGATWNKVTPCNAGLDVLRREAADYLNGKGVVAYEFDTISISDGMSMGSEGMRASLVSRDWIADSVELVMRAQCYDGLLGIAGCDKSIPGMLMAIVRMNVPAVFAYAGSLAPGRLENRDISLQDVYEAIGAQEKGNITGEQLKAIEMAACPGVGTCAGMFSANTMASVSEALGLTRSRNGFAAGSSIPIGCSCCIARPRHCFTLCRLAFGLWMSFPASRWRMRPQWRQRSAAQPMPACICSR